MNLDEIIEQHLDSNNASGHLAPSNGILAQASQGWEPSNLVLVEYRETDNSALPRQI
jgi:hypothetical protein